MLWTIAIIAALVWVLGLVTNYTFDGLLHGLLVVAIVLILIGVFKAGSKATAATRRGPP